MLDFTEQMGSDVLVKKVYLLSRIRRTLFTGKTGFGAFSHHVPEDGHCCGCHDGTPRTR